MSINQLSVFVENQKGRLSEITDIIAENGIDIRAMSIADTREFGILRLIVKDAASAKKLLEDAGYIVSVTDVVGVEIEDEPGSLAVIMRMLTENDINMEYMYAFLTKKSNKAYLVLRVADSAAVEALVEAQGLRTLTREDIEEM